jgi:hypothetical protein
VFLLLLAYNAHNRIGGDPHLSPIGVRYSIALSRFIKQHHPPGVISNSANSLSYFRNEDPNDPEVKKRRMQELHVWSSTLMRTRETVKGFMGENEYDVRHMRNLCEINGGICENMTYVSYHNTTQPSSSFGTITKVFFIFLVWDWFLYGRKKLKNITRTSGKPVTKTVSFFVIPDPAENRTKTSLNA